MIRQDQHLSQMIPRALTALSLLLIAAGLLGFIVPADLALMSGATAYNIFHLVAGAIGITVRLHGSTQQAKRFLFVFGCVDLWQAVAGPLGFFPAVFFALRPADHIVHLLLGGMLIWVGLRRETQTC